MQGTPPPKHSFCTNTPRSGSLHTRQWCAEKPRSKVCQDKAHNFSEAPFFEAPSPTYASQVTGHITEHFFFNLLLHFLPQNNSCWRNCQVIIKETRHSAGEVIGDNSVNGDYPGTLFHPGHHSLGQWNEPATRGEPRCGGGTCSFERREIRSPRRQQKQTAPGNNALP